MHVDPAHAGAIIATHNGAAQQIEVDAHAPPWLVDLEHDRNTRRDMMATMVADGTAYDHEEDSMIQCRLAMLAADSAGKVRRLKSEPTVDSCWTKLDEESGLLVGNTQLVIRGAGPLDIISYLMDADSRHQQSRLDPKVDVRREIREINVHHTITFYELKTAPFHNRTFLDAMVGWGRSCQIRSTLGAPALSQPTRR